MSSLPDLIPIEALFGNPDRALPTLSPDGTRMAYLAPVDGVLNVWVRTVGSKDDRPVTSDTDRGVRSYSWAWDDRHITYVQDVGGDENWHYYATDVETGETRDLTPFDGVQARFVGRNKEYPTTMLIGLNRRDPTVHDVFRVDIVTGELSLAAENPGDVASWVADRELRVRAATKALDDGSNELHVRDDEESDWRLIATWQHEDAMSAAAIAFDASGHTLFVRDPRDAEAARLVRMDVTTGATTVIAEDPIYDLTHVTFDPNTYEPQAAMFLRQRMEWVALDPAVAEDFAVIATIQRGDPVVIGRDASDRVWLLAFTTDDGPVAYWTYNRDTKESTFLFHSREGLADFTLAQMDPIEYQARDGLTVRGYATFPPDAGREGLPTVLLVHGGPWSRDAWGFSPYTQWLANRGYLVLQINFRGSTGYGKSFVNAGDREWAAAMHDDLIDGIEWAVAKGYADRERVAIMGGSYGGYAALVGATFTPDVFRCAISIVGPSNLKTLIESIPPYWKSMRAMFHKRMGNPATDAEFMWSRSPLSRVDQIKIPMLIAQGANDPRVPESESQQIVDAMAERGIEHEYVLYPDEGHGFAKPANVLSFVGRADAFLAKYLGGRSGS